MDVRQRLLYTLLCFPFAATAQNVALQIDGRINEDGWQQAQRFDQFVVVEPYTLGQPAYPTEVWLLPTPEGIAVAFRCRQPADVARERERTPRDADMPGDRVNVFIDFNADGEIAYNFTIALSGAIQDATITNENAYSTDWDGDWKHAVSEDTDSWSAEFLIPWTVAAMRDSGAEKRTIAVMFDRVLGVTDERSGYPAASFMRPRFVSEYAKVEIEQHQRSLLQVFPYATASRDLKNSRFDHKFGGDLYWKPSGEFQLTASLNPDFGQVEADELVVNFDAIETFFSDRRPFFTENQAQFDLRTPDNGLLIYTRRIGGPMDDGSGRAADIDAAIKLNGSAVGLDYGVLLAQESDYADDIGALYYAQRLLRPGDALTVGYLGTYTERPFLERDAQVHAVDATWRAGEHWQVSGQAIVSAVDRPAGDKNGQGLWARIDYTPSAAWRQELELTHFDRDLDFNDMGFQRRPSLNEMEWTVEFQENIEDPSSLLRGRNWRGEFQGRTNDSGERLPLVLILDHERQYRSGATWEFNVYVESAGYNDLVSRGNGLVRIPLRTSLYTEYDTPRLGRWQLEAGITRFEEGLGGAANGFNTTIYYYANSELTFDGSLAWFDSDDWVIWERDRLFGRYRREQIESTLSINWFPAPRHEFRAKLQWLGLLADAREGREIGPGGVLVPSTATVSDFSVNNFGLQLRYRYEYAPQSDIYVVYGRGGFVEEIDDDRDGLGDLWREAIELRDADQILLKVRKRF